jgi:hypothetical protein
VLFPHCTFHRFPFLRYFTSPVAATVRVSSFVCAADRTTVLETVKNAVNDKTNLYFEKFFPVSIYVPVPDEDALRRAGVDRVVKAFERQEPIIAPTSS